METAIVVVIVGTLCYVQLVGEDAPAIVRGALFFLMAGSAIGVISLLFYRSKRASRTTCT